MLTVVNLKIINVHTIVFSCQISIPKQVKANACLLSPARNILLSVHLYKIK